MPLPPNCRYDFPTPHQIAQIDPNGEGLIGIGADLACDTLIEAYRHGIFPWFSEGNPIAWYCPDPRCIIYPQDFQPSKSLSRRIKNSDWTLRINTDFAQVIHACAEVRAYADGTWIGEDMIEAYTQLHHQGIAHSVEVWDGETLIGGLYGLKLGQAFFGESMFHRVTDASKVAFFGLMKLCQASDFAWVDCQLPNEHLISLGAVTLPREQFLAQLAIQIDLPSYDWSKLSDKHIKVSELLSQNNPFDLGKGKM
ncbi:MULTISPECIES: leucyl/phenylalanyl-tRNA--protein transferase [unclassified Moraxella]|uniref:leucyl/phenylalanyl-tRNA--protein transferase n=1 Tax=unclassified Moraxella TaxID=2685852 RepID=UPI003AF613EE